MAAKDKRESIKEPSVVIKPMGGFGGLDAIHVALVILVAILMALLLAVAYTKPLPIVTNSTAPPGLNCSYGAHNSTCLLPAHNASQIRQDAEEFLAGYNYVNTSLSLLPYLSEVGRMNLTYSPSYNQWYVTIPILNPSDNQSLLFALLINDTDTSQITPLIQTIRPGASTNNFVASKGVVQIAGQSECSVESPLQVYWFVDPYSPGGLSSMANMTSLQSKYGSQIDASPKILFTQSSQKIASQHGLNNSLALGSYLFCASNQTTFPSFVSNLNQYYNGSYMPASLLSSIASDSGINGSQLDSCLATAGTFINRQAVLAKYYNISSTPAVVTDCRYLSIPQTEADAIEYANSSIV